MQLTNKITGELISYDKYRFVDGKLLASIVKDTINFPELANYHQKLRDLLYQAALSLEEYVVGCEEEKCKEEKELIKEINELVN